MNSIKYYKFDYLNVEKFTEFIYQINFYKSLDDP